MKKLMTCVLLSALATTTNAQEQRVTLSYAPAAESGGAGMARIHYEASNNALTTGIGFRIHFDSRVVQILAIDELMSESSLGLQILSDDEDHDANPATDKFINVAWVDLLGDWPDRAIVPAPLLEVMYDTSLPEEADVFAISASATAAGFAFSTQVSN